MTKRRSGSPWTNPNLDLIAERALLDVQIFKDTAAAALKEKVRLEDLRLAKIKQDELEKANIAAGLNADGSVKTGDPEGGVPKEGDLPEAVDLTPEQQTAWDAFEEKFEGLEGMENVRADVLSGAFDPLNLPTDSSRFNNQIKSAAGILPGGYSTESGFYTFRSEAGYEETYADEPDPNPRDAIGNVLWVPNADGTGWVRNKHYTDPNATGPGSADSIAKTMLLLMRKLQQKQQKLGLKVQQRSLLVLLERSGCQ